MPSDSVKTTVSYAFALTAPKNTRPPFTARPSRTVSPAALVRTGPHSTAPVAPSYLRVATRDTRGSAVSLAPDTTAFPAASRATP